VASGDPLGGNCFWTEFREVSKLFPQKTLSETRPP
jgi:hypothetical protein